MIILILKLNEVDTRAFIEQLKLEGMLKRDEAKNSLGGLGGLGGPLHGSFLLRREI